MSYPHRPPLMGPALRPRVETSRPWTVTPNGRPVRAMPLNSSNSMKLLKKSRSEKGATAVVDISVALLYFQRFHDVCIRPPTSSSQTRVTGMKIFQPRRMIWS